MYEHRLLERTTSLMKSSLWCLKWAIQPKSIVLWLATANLGFNLFHAFTSRGICGVAEAWYLYWEPTNLPTILWLAAVLLRIGKLATLCVSALISGIIFFHWTHVYFNYFSSGELAQKIDTFFILFDAFLHLMQVLLAAVILILSVLELIKQHNFVAPPSPR